jgi:hypothetical protein
MIGNLAAHQPEAHKLRLFYNPKTVGQEVMAVACQQRSTNWLLRPIGQILKTCNHSWK